MEEAHPLLGIELDASNSAPLDLSRITLTRLGIDSDVQAALSEYIYTGKYRYGGYGEQRSIYDSSSLFKSDGEPRNIHLGIDFWAEAAHDIYAPWDGEIISAHDNAGKGDYGPTLIIKHTIAEQVLYSLYGHLSRASLYHKPGDKIVRGTAIASIGNPTENGGWLPHLHFQLILDLEGYVGDYPGVCKQSEWERYQRNCPDPDCFGLCG